MNLQLILGLLLITHFAYGQNEHVKRLDNSKITVSEIDLIVKRLMDTAHIQGLGLSILNNNKPVFIKSYGFKNKPRNEMLDTASIMYGASFSKAVFGYLTLMLVKEKKLDLDKPLYQYLSKPIGEYEYFSDLRADERWKLITAMMCEFDLFPVLVKY